MSGTAEAGAVAMIAKLESVGYTRTDRGSAAMMHKREFRLSRFGVVDTVFGIAIEPGTATAASLVAHDLNTKEAALELKSGWPRGFGGSVEMYPVLFAEAADTGAVEAAASAAPKRWALMSAHALVHGPQREVVLFDGRAIWGAAYVKSQRDKLRSMIGV